MTKRLYFLTITLAGLFLNSCNQDTQTASTNSDNSAQTTETKSDEQPSVDNDTNEESSTNAVSENTEANPFIGKYFYISMNREENFETFFENPEFNFVLYFPDNSNVKYFVNLTEALGGWQAPIKGIYSFKDNKEVVFNIPKYFSGLSEGENFGGDVTIIDDKKILVSVDGKPKYKLVNFTPEPKK